MGITPSAPFLHDWRTSAPGRLPETLQAPSSAWARRAIDSQQAWLSSPIDFLVSPQCKLSFSSAVSSHHLDENLSCGDIIAVNAHVFVTSPATTLASVLRRCTRAESLRIIGEFCGLYAVDEGFPQGFKDAQPLVSVDELRIYCATHPSSRSARLLKSHLPYALDSCASPAETSLAALLVMPYRNGGYSLPRPTMNAAILPDMRDAKLVDRSYYVADATWEQEKLVVEYDSRAQHTSAAAMAHDSIRKMALEAMGYRVLSITPGILMDPGLFDKAARNIARQLNRRLYTDRAGDTWHEQRELARAALLGVPRDWHLALGRRAAV